MSNAAEETQFELEVGDAEATEVEIPEVETDADVVVEEEESPQENELENYSESVQKRINRLTKKMRDAEREREEAIKYAQNVQNESNQIRHRMQNLDQGYMSEYGTRLSLQQAQVEANLKRAVELGDADATVEAQKQLSQLAVVANEYTQAQKQSQKYAEEQQYYQQMQAQQPQAQQPQAQQPQRPDAKAEQWAEKNAWFGQDEAMTFAAFGIHKKLIEDEGFDPQSDDYYNELDSRVKREFPHKFGNNSSASRRPAQNVAGVSRSSSSGRNGKRVKLSPTQVAIAKKLGVPLEEYAKYVKE